MIHPQLWDQGAFGFAAEAVELGIVTIEGGRCGRIKSSHSVSSPV
jgi:hypothetical protein